MRKSRKEIDNFLLELEKYLEGKEEYEVKDLIHIFQDKGQPRINSLGVDKTKLDLKRLCSFMNGNRDVGYSYYTTRKGDVIKSKKAPVKATSITAEYIRRLAYDMDWHYVKELTYKDLFEKAIYHGVNSLELQLKYMERHWYEDKKLPEIYIPKELFSSLDLCIFEK